MVKATTLYTGSLSPVREDSSTEKFDSSITSQSAGMRFPSDKKIISVGTRSDF